MLFSSLRDFKCNSKCRTRNSKKEMNKLNGFLLLLVLVSFSWADETTTDLSFQDSAVEVKVTENTNAVGTTEGESLIDYSTTEPTRLNEATSGGNTELQTEAAKPNEQLICSAAGVQAHDSNCQLYRECLATGSADGSLHLYTKSCPEREAFNPEMQRCSRDISSCPLPVQCLNNKVIADPEGNSSYYLCQPRFSGSGFHIFRVYCGKNEVFNPSLGACLVDFKHLVANGWTISTDIPDIYIVKKEIKQLKKDHNEAAKKEKELQRAEEKLQKEAEKLAKQQKKLLMQAQKFESASFVCESEGNFPSKLGDNLYLGCINSKNKVMAIPLECSKGGIFEPQTGTCIKIANSEESSRASEAQD